MKIDILNHYPNYDLNHLNDLYDQTMTEFHHKIVVLDDDPTGIQKVHGIHVYTDWDESSILEGFQSEENMFFILTNSRAFSKEKTKKVHEEIAKRVQNVSKQLNKPFIIISRSDSTLRGHFPLETATINATLNHQAEGEIMIPFFKEGGRYTINNVHYVEKDNKLIPAAKTEFAKDRTFGFTKSHLGEYIEEKSKGLFKKEDVTYIELDDLRSLNIDKITSQLLEVNHFKKVVVNAISDDDLKVFAIALIRAINSGKYFLFRTAATFTKIIGHISDRDLLSSEEMIVDRNKTGGLIIVGSHVNKTTQQLKQLLKLDTVNPIEFNSDLVLDENKFEAEIQAKIQILDQKLKNGQTSVIYTKRKRLDLGEGLEEKELELSVKISDGLTKVIKSLTAVPKYIIAKGGITSSEIGTKALNVRKAEVLGQALPGIPVWRTDSKSKYPNIPYIIFPGNVGSTTDLYTIVKKLEK